MTDRDSQTEGREANGAIPPGKPDPTSSDAEMNRTGRHERTTAGPDGPDATEVGDTFKTPPG